MSAKSIEEAMSTIIYNLAWMEELEKGSGARFVAEMTAEILKSKVKTSEIMSPEVRLF